MKQRRTKRFNRDFYVEKNFYYYFKLKMQKNNQMRNFQQIIFNL
jgi:hypothetical protein